MVPKDGRFTNEKARLAHRRAYDTLAARWPVPSAEVDVATSFGTTRVRKSVAGDGAPIMLLPGISGNGLVWHPFIEEFARDRVVYTPDVIGWSGRCVQTAPLRDGADIAQWVVDMLDGLGGK